LDIVGLSFVLLDTNFITLASTHRIDCLATSKIS
jgi:rRNA-processing protein FCF1